jgi:hypothetical protein
LVCFGQPDSASAWTEVNNYDYDYYYSSSPPYPSDYLANKGAIWRYVPYYDDDDEPGELLLLNRLKESTSLPMEIIDYCIWAVRTISTSQLSDNPL